mgnify:CR=1 FL=1
MCNTCGCKGAEGFEAEDAFRGMRKGSTKIIEGFDVKKLDKYTYRITDETLKDGAFVVLMYETQIIPYEKRHDMEGWNWKEGWKFTEASFDYGMLRNPMKQYNRSMSYGFNTQMEALKFLKKAYDNGDFEDGYLIFDAEEFGAENADEYEGKVVNITNAGDKVFVTLRHHHYDDFGNPMDEPFFRPYNIVYQGSMEDVMLNDYTNSRGQKITFDSETDVKEQIEEFIYYHALLQDSIRQIKGLKRIESRIASPLEMALRNRTEMERRLNEGEFDFQTNDYLNIYNTQYNDLKSISDEVKYRLHMAESTMREYERRVNSIPIGIRNQVLLRMMGAEEFESEMKGSIEYERDKTTKRYDRETILQDYVVEIDDEDIVPYSKNLENLERAKEEIKEDIKSEVESNPENYVRQLSEIEAASSTKVEFEDGTTRDIYAYGELKSPQIIDTDLLDVDAVEYSESSGSYFAETLGAESTPFAEGRNAAKTMWMPDSTKEDYYSGVDTEYMITYDITPDELMQEIENNSSRYLQFFSGWDDGWNESSLVGLGVIQDPMQEEFDDDDDVMMDYEFAGEYIGDEYVPSDKEVMAYGGVAVLLFSAVFGYKLTERLLKKSETFKAPETCTNDDDCPDGKVCVDGQCLPICEDDGDCASWQECRSDLHPTEKVCGEDLTYSTSNPFIPSPKPQENAEQPPEKTESRFSPKNLAIGGGVVAVALVGLTAMRMKGKGDE